MGLDDAPMSGSIKIALKLALVTGQRIGEVCAVERNELNLADAVWSIPEEKSKNGLAHTVPLSSLAIVLFEDAMRDGDTKYLFPSRSLKVPGIIQPMAVSTIDKALRRCLPALGFAEDPFRAHDLRRTVATGQAELGIAESTIARVLNHKSKIGKTITGRVYIQHGFEREKRHALEAWTTRLVEITPGQGRTSNVVLIGKGS
jgi:integrase